MATFLRNPGDPGINSATIAWTSASNGSYSESLPIVGTILGVSVDPGSTAPTALYDITLTNAEGVDLFGNGGANLSATVSSYFVPVATASDGATKAPFTAAGSCTFAVANAGSAKVGSVTIIFRT